MNDRANTTINANQAAASGSGDLSDLLCRGNCRLEGLRGMVHALIIGLDGDGDLSANPRIVTHALYGVLYQIEEIENIFESAEQIDATSGHDRIPTSKNSQIS
jgi:hypothetical protein